MMDQMGSDVVQHIADGGAYLALLIEEDEVQSKLNVKSVPDDMMISVIHVVQQELSELLSKLVTDSLDREKEVIENAILKLEALCEINPQMQDDFKEIIEHLGGLDEQ